MRPRTVVWIGLAVLPLLAAPPLRAAALDPDKAEVQAVDRFSDAAAMLFRRSADPTLPMPNQPINMDGGPFITHGLGQAGQRVAYYNFDVQSPVPAPLFVLQDVDGKPVPGQLNLVDTIPGDPGANDFWRVTVVQTPAGYRANQITSAAALNKMLSDPKSGFTATTTNMLVNCPVVPAGSRARMRLGGGTSGLSRGWYRDKVVFYFNFDEAALAVANGRVPLSTIWVMFANNKDPSDGFVTEPGTGVTHNLLVTVPGQPGYSPLWIVGVLDNQRFDAVRDLTTALQGPVITRNAGTVNCPVVAVAAP